MACAIFICGESYLPTLKRDLRSLQCDFAWLTFDGTRVNDSIFVLLAVEPAFLSAWWLTWLFTALHRDAEDRSEGARVILSC